MTITSILYTYIGVQILYNGHYHWVATAFFKGSVYLYDSMAGDRLLSKVEEQLAMLYPDGARELGRQRSLIVTSVPVQQQEGSTDCGLFAIANAFHAAQGDSVSGLHFDQGKMREHLSKRCEQGQPTPFPQTTGKVQKSKRKHHIIHLHCKCSLPESYDTEMVQCNSCKWWYHFKCVGIKTKPKGNKWCCIYC